MIDAIAQTIETMPALEWLIVVALGAAMLLLLPRQAWLLMLLAIAPLLMMALKQVGYASDFATVVAFSASLFVVTLLTAYLRRRADRLEQLSVQLSKRLDALEMAEARLQNFLAHTTILPAPGYPSAIARSANGNGSPHKSPEVNVLTTDGDGL